jgi:hypothetical protein
MAKFKVILERTDSIITSAAQAASVHCEVARSDVPKVSSALA